MVAHTNKTHSCRMLHKNLLWVFVQQITFNHLWVFQFCIEKNLIVGLMFRKIILAISVFCAAKELNNQYCTTQKSNLGISVFVQHTKIKTLAFQFFVQQENSIINLVLHKNSMKMVPSIKLVWLSCWLKFSFSYWWSYLELVCMLF